MSESVDTQSSYTSTASVEDVVRRVQEVNRLVLLPHSKPDGDAIGSSLAMARTLERLGKRGTPLFLPPWSHTFDYIVDTTEVMHPSGGCWSKPPLSTADGVIVLDTGSWAQVHEAKGWLEERTRDTLIIDHHASGDPDMAPLRLIETSAAATCEIVARVCTRLLGVAGPAELPTDIAEALFVGIATDTGWFRHSNTTARTHRLAADLLDAGANPTALFELLYQSDRVSRLRLLERALSGMRIINGGRAALLVLSREDYEVAGAELDEASGFTDIVQGVESVRVVVMATEMSDNLTKVSMRSKAGDGAVDVNQLARSLGGGGHVHAAGARLHMSLREAIETVTKLLEEATA